MYLYQNFELYNPFITIDLIVWAMFAGFVVAALMAVYNKRVIGGFVKSVISGDCLSPEKAKTIVDLGYGTDWFIKNALRTDTVLRRFVVRVDGNAGESGDVSAPTPASASEAEDGDGGKNKMSKRKKPMREVIDFKTAKFYIPEELKYRAEVRYAGRGTDIIAFGVCVVILAAAAFAAIFMIPELLQLIDNFMGTL